MKRCRMLRNWVSGKVLTDHSDMEADILFLSTTATLMSKPIIVVNDQISV